MPEHVRMLDACGGFYLIYHLKVFVLVCCVSMLNSSSVVYVTLLSATWCIISMMLSINLDNMSLKGCGERPLCV